ncbi:hypothetical protein [Brumicola nitratireducens]|uniref:Uncharacterized protein n=1 Tax=Glaciecola nitratireducens (strain JCM 12485 / KCTC 12276 / FR1064) TaxID=1085623 RepID=G4QF95_GLANF|nr:hypothetical protein [Glaciecola nitratireducens]AEP28439.1 hypothetical protein GNIT_0285 [Glaciecola nitratireducens FR1064]
MLAMHFDRRWLDMLLKTHKKTFSGSCQNVDYEAKVVIPEYKHKVANYFADIINGNIDDYCRRAELPLVYDNYGVEIEFKTPTQLDVHEEDQILKPSIKELLQKVGPVTFKNAYFSAQLREVYQRNSFPHLNFHIDRNVSMPTRFSIYTRDPFDEEQRFPRESSTLFIASAVGYLQAVREGLIDPNKTKGIHQSFEIFRKMNIEGLIGELIIEQRWDRPYGVGELSMLDNATEMHSSYERICATKGYRIGVRYVA